METKSWLWRRKPSEKAIIKEKALDLERSLKNLNEQLSSARHESDAKDDLVEKQAKVAEEALAGWEKAEAEAASFKQELDVALSLKSIAEEKVVSIDSALKECLQQLHALKNEHQLKMSQEQERTRALKEMLVDKNKILDQLSTENSRLCVLHDKKKNLIEDLIASQTQSEDDFTAIVERLDSSEKGNESLKYEIRMLHNELELRSQERELNLKAAEATQKQHIENVRKINRLESECQRLRVMIRKRLPGPATIAKMRSEVEMLGNIPTETRRKTNPAKNSYLPVDSVPKVWHDTLSKKLNRLHAMEDENKTLKETLARKNSELQFSRVMFAQTSCKLSQCEKQLKELLKEAAGFELARSSSLTYELAASVLGDGGNKDNVSCAESWASALISQLEQFRNEKQENPLLASGSSNLSLTNDFGDMEKMSIICVDKPESASISIFGEEYNSLTPKTLDLKEEALDSTGKELVLVDDFLLDFGGFTHGHHSSFTQVEKGARRLQSIGKVTEQKHHTTELSLDVIPHGIRVGFDEKENSSLGSSGDASSMNNVNQNKNQQLQLSLEQSLHCIIKLTEEVIQRVNLDCNRQQVLSLSYQETDPWHKPASPGEQTACIFLWESSELSMILKRFITVCKNTLDGKADAEKFVGELASTLGWMIDHIFSFQGITQMEETMKKRFNVEFPCYVDGYVAEVNTPNKFKLRLGGFVTDEIKSKLGDENRKLVKEIADIENAKKDLEEKLKSVSAKNLSLLAQFQESENLISNLQSELTTLKNSGGRMEDHIENQEVVSQDLGTQLSVAFVELNETQEKPPYEMVPEEKELRTDLEISAASEKLAECQETILKLGKQLKALASPKDTALFDKVFSSPVAMTRSRNPRSLDQLLARENDKFEDPKSPQTKEIICSEPQNPLPTAPVEIADASSLNDEENLIRHALQAEPPNWPHEKGASYKQKLGTEVGTLVAVPKKQKGRLGFLRTLLSRKRKEGNIKLVLPSSSLNAFDY